MNAVSEITKLRARVLELEKERDAAREEAGARRQDLADFTRIVSKTVDDLKQEIAAQQLVIEKMREALQMLDRVSNISCGKVQEALALPSDTTALNEVRKADRERCAKVCEELRHPDGYSGENVDWCAGTDHCAAAIRKLGEQE